MSARYATRDAVLTYLQVDPAPVAVRRILVYMGKMHHVGAGATRECLRRLLSAGAIAHPARGFYQIGGGNDA